MEKRLPLANGTILNEHYTIVKLLGSGGFGAVYEAKSSLGSPVAIKETYISDDALQKDIEREALLLAKLEHEDFPRVIGRFVVDNDGDKRHYLVMELIRGKDLQESLQENRKPFAVNQVLEWADSILDALQDLHDNGIIHRDIKPANLKLTPRGRIKVIDLGIAKGAVSDNSSAASSSLAAATPNFSPLEQVLRLDVNHLQMLYVSFFDKANRILEQGTDQTSDIYSVGATLYILLTNVMPSGSPARALSVWSNKPDTLRPANEINPKVPLEISNILQKALAIESKDRFQSANEMREALKNPSQFVVERAEKVKDSDTIIDEDFDKNIEQEKQRQREQAEHARLQREAEEKRRQEIIEQNRLKQLQELEAEKEGQRLRDVQAKTQKAAFTPFVQPSVPAKPNNSRTIVGILAVIGLMIGLPVFLIIAGYIFRGDNSTVGNPATNKPASNNSNTLKNSIGMEFIKIPSGSFMMGSPTSEKDRSNDETQHQVTISKDFYLGKYEVTQAQWKAVMNNNNPSYFKGDNLPVEQVSWDEAQAFIKKLNAKGEGTYRLPTEAEWEYSARGGNSGKWSFGDDENELGKYAWYSPNSGSKTHEVGTKQPNDFKLYDMHGNVWEWCEDLYGAYPSGNVTDPKGTTGSFRVLRGGGWGNDARDLRSANRFYGSPSNRNGDLGFRLIRVAE